MMNLKNAVKKLRTAQRALDDLTIHHERNVAEHKKLKAQGKASEMAALAKIGKVVQTNWHRAQADVAACERAVVAAALAEVRE